MADKVVKKFIDNYGMGYDIKYYNTPLYKAWSGMKTRCLNKNYHLYHRYGGRGIMFCEKWKYFKGFLEDMGDSYIDGFSLDRIDNNGNYYKENCRWADRITQCNNRSTSTFFYIDGIKRTLAEWIRFSGQKSSTVRQRFFGYKWPIKKALFTYKN